MAERPKGYGMTAELQDKKDAKWDVPMAKEAADWIQLVTGENGPGGITQDSIQDWLKNGVILCNVINVLQPGSVPKIAQSKMAFKMMENIGNFLSACEKFGCVKQDLFQTVDLYEGQNMPQVINGLHSLGRKAQSKNKDFPSIGPKESTESKREFTEEQKKEGQKIIGLQMGSNKGASQAGSTPYGLGRQIEKTNLKV